MGVVPLIWALTCLAPKGLVSTPTYQTASHAYRLRDPIGDNTKSSSFPILPLLSANSHLRCTSPKARSFRAKIRTCLTLERYVKPTRGEEGDFQQKRDRVPFQASRHGMNRRVAYSLTSIAPHKELPVTRYPYQTAATSSREKSAVPARLNRQGLATVRTSGVASACMRASVWE